MLSAPHARPLSRCSAALLPARLPPCLAFAGRKPSSSSSWLSRLFSSVKLQQPLRIGALSRCNGAPPVVGASAYAQVPAQLSRLQWQHPEPARPPARPRPPPPNTHKHTHSPPCCPAALPAALNIAMVMFLMRFWPVPGGRSPLGQVEPVTVQASRRRGIWPRSLLNHRSVHSVHAPVPPLLLLQRACALSSCPQLQPITGRLRARPWQPAAPPPPNLASVGRPPIDAP